MKIRAVFVAAAVAALALAGSPAARAVGLEADAGAESLSLAEEQDPPAVKCTWLKPNDGVCVDTSAKSGCGGSLRYPEPKQYERGIKTYCKNADGSRMDPKWQCCQGGTALAGDRPELTEEELKWHSKLLAGEYADSAKYDAQLGEFTEPKELQALFAKYVAKDGMDPKTMNRCADQPSAPAAGGDELTCTDGLYPAWVEAYRRGVSSRVAPSKVWAWPETEQAKSRLAEAYWLSYFVDFCKFGSADRVPANVRFFLKNLFKSNNNRQSGIVGGCGPDSHAYCAAASSKAMIYGFAEWGYTVPPAGWTWFPSKFSRWMPQAGKQVVAPGDVLQYQSARSPCSGHVATVVCRDPSAGGSGTYADSMLWVISGNAGPGGTVAVDRIRGAPVPENFEIHSTWKSFAESELAKQGRHSPATGLSDNGKGSKGGSAGGGASGDLKAWQKEVDELAEKLHRERGPKDGQAFIYSVNRVSEVQPWILDEQQSSGKLVADYNIRRTDEPAWQARMARQGKNVQISEAPHSILIGRGGFGPCTVSSEPGVCLPRNECPSHRFFMPAGKNVDPICPDAPVGRSIGCCLPSGQSCGGGAGECYSPSFLLGSAQKTFCSGFSFDSVECTESSKGSKCCVPAPKDGEAKPEPVAPFMVARALDAQHISEADRKECTLAAGSAGFCLPQGAKPLLCPGNLEFPSSKHKTGCDKTQWCCGTAGTCTVGGSAGECISKKVASLCPHPYGAQPSSQCKQDYLCCAKPPAEQDKSSASQSTQQSTGSDDKSSDSQFFFF